MESEVTIIPQIRQVYYAAYGNLPTTQLRVGALGFATDRLIVYRWSGAAWQALTFHCSSGLAANIPTAGDLPNGSLYFETDTLILKQVQAGAWVAISQAGVQVVTGQYTGDGTASRQITTGFKCSFVFAITDAGTDACWGVLPTRSMSVEGNVQIKNVTLHASDGFVTGTGTHMNVNAQVYDYWAISE